jgi:hypothetical protein
LAEQSWFSVCWRRWAALPRQTARRGRLKPFGRDEEAINPDNNNGDRYYISMGDSFSGHWPTGYNGYPYYLLPKLADPKLYPIPLGCADDTTTTMITRFLYEWNCWVATSAFGER